MAVVAAVLVVGLVGLVGGGVSGASVVGERAAKKKATSCSLLTASQIEEVVGTTVTGPGDAGTLDIACSYDIGPGLGDPGGGMVIVQYYSGRLGKGVWSAAKANGEKVGKYYWDPTAEILTGAKKGKVVGMSVTYTGGANAPEHGLVQGQSEQLLTLALKKV